MLHNLRSLLTSGIDWYNTFQKRIHLHTGIEIRNKLLAQELEKECDKKESVLTYADYLTIDQFGKNGFYSLHNRHGQTDIDLRWDSALAKYSIKNGYDTIIEFGCGTGELGVATCNAYKKIANGKLSWIGVEIDKQAHNKIFDKFKKNSLTNFLGAIVTSIDDIPPINNALIVFPYSLDNIPPQVFLNTQTQISYPNAMLGIIVKNGMLSETIMPQNLLQKKGIKLEKGFFTQNDFTYKLTGWKLHKGQRLYLATDIFSTIYHYAKKFKNATIIIIDEFRNEPWEFSLANLGTPKSLYEKNLTRNDVTRYYRDSGEYNLYHPLYKYSLFKFLTLNGFRSNKYDIEQKLASELRGKTWFSLSRNYSTYAFIIK